MRPVASLTKTGGFVVKPKMSPWKKIPNARGGFLGI
jgi:hypothetical protein